MKNILKLSLNIILLLALSLSIIILFTEKTDILTEKFSSSIADKVRDFTKMQTEISSIKLKWKGLYPNIKLDNFILKDESNKVVIQSKTTTIEFDLFDSISSGEFSIRSFIIDGTVVSVTVSDDKVFFNNQDVNKITENNFTNNNIPLIVFKDSTIKLFNENTNKSDVFFIEKLTAEYVNHNINIKANFLHKYSKNPVHIHYMGKISDNSLSGKLYISGNSIILPRDILPKNLQSFNIQESSLRAWVDINESKVSNIVGNLSSNSISLPLQKINNKIDNVSADFYYHTKEGNILMGLTRLNYKYQKQTFNNNKIILYKDDKNNTKIFFREIQTSFLKDYTSNYNLTYASLVNTLPKSTLRNLEVHFNKGRQVNYYNANIESFNFNIKKKLDIHQVNLKLEGNNEGGMLIFNNGTLRYDSKNIISGVSGKLSYKIKGKSFYFSTSELSNDQKLKIAFVGKKISKTPTIKINISGSLDDIKNISDDFNDLGINNYSGRFSLKVFYHQGKFLTKTELSDISLNYRDMFLSSNKINLTSLNKRINSDIFSINIDGKDYKTSVITNVTNSSHEYIAKSNGYVNEKLFIKTMKLDEKVISGLTKVNTILTYNSQKNNLSFYLTSDLNGIAIDGIPPFSKQKNNRVNFILNYQHFPSKDYPLEIIYDKHKIRTKFSEKYSIHEIKSPWIRGFVQIPSITSEDEIKASLEFIDTNFFSKDNKIKKIPRINLVSKHLKTEDIILDNVHITLNPTDEYIEIKKFDFANPHIKMSSYGKWFLGDDESTFLVASMESDNFGLALKSLGYSQIIRGGKLKANLEGEWGGALNDFAFSSTQGKISFDIVDGQITELDQGTQAIGQVLGLFSLSSIPKRLSLDFSDFFSRGLRFENLDCDITLDSGIAKTEKMNIIGSFGEMRLTGDSDLIEKTHDQVLIFIPDLSSTSLVTGAVIGGPIGAAASIFYDKLLKEFGVDTNKLAGIEYSIKGSWENPKIKVTQSFKPITN